ncbi:MAG: DUF167 domain-containing protein [archaeon]|nr:DUF167 domain-containing protein [archaeon]
MGVSDVVCAVNGDIELYVYVSPHASRSGFECVDEWRKRLVIKVKSPPRNNEANKEVVALIEKTTKHKCEITHGWKDRHKTVLIHGTEREVIQLLKGAIKEVSKEK